MKSGTLTKVKFARLARELGGLPRWQAVGILESIWNLTVENAPQGDIGRFSNADIAAAIEWSGDPDKLITALVKTRWLDEHAEHRLIVHDWAQHAPDFVKKRLKYQGLECVTAPDDGKTSGSRKISANLRKSPPTEPSPTESEPSPVQSNRGQHKHRTPVRDPVVPSEPARSGGSASGSGFEKSRLSDSGPSGESARQIEDLRTNNAKVRIAELLRIAPPEDHPEGSRNRKQASGDYVTISKAVEHWRGDPTALKTLEQLAAEVAEGKLIKKPAAAWVKRLKDADMFYL